MTNGGGDSNIVKRNGRRESERFNRQKLHSSIVAACLSAGAPTGQAESIARAVTEHVATWLVDHPEVTSEDIRRVTAKYLRAHHPDAGYLYEQHRMIV